MSKYRIRLKNYKMIEDFDEIFETGNFYLLRGRNNIGKTSVIQGVSSGFNAENKNANPIGKFGDSAVIEFDFVKNGDEYHLRYELENKNGKIVDSIILVSDKNKKINTKSDIRKLLGFNDFTVDNFFAYGLTAEGRRKQAEILKQLFSPEAKFELDLIDAEINTKNGKLYKERAALNERKNTIEAIVKRSNFTVEEQDRINKLKDIKKKKDLLLTEISAFGNIEEKITLIEEIQEKLDDCQADIKSTKEKQQREVDYLNEEIEALKKKILEKENKIKEIDTHYNKLISTFQADYDVIKEKLTHAEGDIPSVEIYNLKKAELQMYESTLTSPDSSVLINKFKENIKYKKELEEVTKEYETKNNSLEEARKRKQTIFEEADINIPELTIVDGECMYVQGDLLLPFTEEHVSYATGGIPIIKMLVRLNQNVPIILLGKAAEYDEKSRKSILEIAQENDCIVIGDLVDEKADGVKIKIESLY